MGILFLLALVLAWPTFGLSIVAWLVLTIVHAKSVAAKADRREEVGKIIHPLFGGKYAEFYRAINVPVVFHFPDPDKEHHQAGRHIANYLAHNPEEAAIFMEGLTRWKTKGSVQLCDPISAANFERDLGGKFEIRLTAYRAIQALLVNNQNLPCFRNVDFSSLTAAITSMEWANK